MADKFQNKQSKNKGKGRNPYGKPNGKRGNTNGYTNDNASVTSSNNDLRNFSGSVHSNEIEWYSLNPQLLKDASSINFSEVMGYKLPTLFHGAVNQPKFQNVIPGVMSVGFEIGYGVSDSTDSPLNVATQNIYSYIRHANSGRTNYDAPDLMQYLLAMDSIYTWYEHCRRIYGLACLYNAKNVYYPKAVLQALGADADDIVNNLANFRYALNARVPRILSRAIPTIMRMFKRHSWLSGNVFADSTLVDRAGLYVFRPDKLWKYVDQGTPASGFAGFLEPIMVGRKYVSYDEGTQEMMLIDGANMSWIGYINTLDDLLQAVMGSEDAGIMSGDIMKVWGNDLWTVDSVDEQFVVTPVFDDIVAHQIQNCTLNGYAFEGCKVLQNVDANYIQYLPRFIVPNGVPEDYELLNIRQISPTPDAVMESTRCKTFGSYSDATVSGLNKAKMRHLKSEGADAFTVATVFRYTEAGILVGTDFFTEMPIENTTDLMMWAQLLTKFDWHPYVHFLDFTI